MRPDRCVHCGGIVAEGLVEYRGMPFCSDECCEQHDLNRSTNGEPSVSELSAEELEDLNLDEVEFDDENEIDDGLEDDLDGFLQVDF